MEEIDLSDFFYTKTGAADFSIHLAAVSESIYETGFDLEKALTEHFGIKKKDQFISLLRNAKVNIYTNSDLKTFFDRIQKKIADLPILSLVIAFEPTEETFKALSEWFLLNIHREVLFDVTIDTKIIAGATVSFNGKYADCSINTRFNQIFQDAFVNKPILPTEKNPNPQENHQSAEHIVVGR